jgi:hypothetical protein
LSALSQQADHEADAITSKMVAPSLIVGTAIGRSSKVRMGEDLSSLPDKIRWTQRIRYRDLGEPHDFRGHYRIALRN